MKGTTCSRLLVFILFISFGESECFLWRRWWKKAAPETTPQPQPQPQCYPRSPLCQIQQREACHKACTLAVQSGKGYCSVLGSVFSALSSKFLLSRIVVGIASVKTGFWGGLSAVCTSPALAVVYRTCDERCGSDGREEVLNESLGILKNLTAIQNKLDELESTLERGIRQRQAPGEEGDNQWIESVLDAADQIKYNQLLLQTHLFHQFYLKVTKDGSKVFEKILLKKVEGKHGIDWTLWLWDSMVRDLAMKRPKVHCDRMPVYLMKQLMMRNVAIWAQTKLKTDIIYNGGIEEMGDAFRRMQEDQDVAIRKHCPAFQINN